MHDRRLLPPAVALLLALASGLNAAGQPPMHAFMGDSDEVTDSFEVPGPIAVPCSGPCGLYLVFMRHAGDGNFIASLLDRDGKRQANAVNAIGSYSGTRILAVPRGTYLFEIRASGKWQVALAAVDDKDASDLPFQFGASGDSAVGAVRLKPGLLRASLTHEGDRNFIVQLYHVSGNRVGILTNQIGNYKGSVAQKIATAGVYYLDVQADGKWSVALTQ
jgi:hypothetical protein